MIKQLIFAVAVVTAGAPDALATGTMAGEHGTGLAIHFAGPLEIARNPETIPADDAAGGEQPAKAKEPATSDPPPEPKRPSAQPSDNPGAVPDTPAAGDVPAAAGDPVAQNRPADRLADHPPDDPANDSGPDAAAATEPAAGDAAAADDPSAANDPPAEAPADPSAPSTAPPTTLPSGPDAHEIPDTNAPRLLTAQEATLKKQWEQEHGGFTASRFAVRRRLTGFPTHLLTNRDSLPRQSRAFLTRVANDTWRGLRSLTDYESGFPIDHIRIEGTPLPPLAAHIGDYVNVTSIGLQLVCIAAARSIGSITNVTAQNEAVKILDTLARLERHEGQFYNYYDTTSLEPTSTFLSFVDTAWLVAGLIVTRQAFPALASVVNELLDPIDLGYFYDRKTRLMSHGYYVNKNVLSVYNYGAFYTEARLGSLIAIGKGDAPVNHWYAMKRAFPSRCEGGSCPSTHELAYTGRDGRTMQVRAFRWQGRQYVPSWGGSMFEALMPRLVLDERRYAPRSLGPNGEAHAMIQQEYAREVLGYPVWGMSPSTHPESGRYGEFGVPVLGSHGYDVGVVTPHAAALAIAVAPDDAAENLMQLARRYDIYGPFGFYDAVEPANGRVGYSILHLDQAMLFLSIANHLSRGEVPRLFASDPYVKPALALLGEERFFE